jgi:hypothetical protein
MKRNNSGLLVIVFFVIFIFSFSIANATIIFDKIDGQVEMQNLIIRAMNGIVQGFVSITTDTLVVDSSMVVNCTATFTGDIAVGDSVYIGDDLYIVDDLIIGGSGTITGTLQAEHLYSTDDVEVADDILLYNGSVVGIAGNEVITFNSAGSIAVSGADLTVTGDIDVGDDIIMASDNTITNDSANDMVYTGRWGSSYYQELTDIATMDRQHIISGTAKMIGTDPFNSKTQMQGGFFGIQLGNGIEITDARTLYGSENKATLDRDMSNAGSWVIGSLDKVSIRDTCVFAGIAVGNYSRLERSNTATIAQAYNYYAEKSAAGFTAASILSTAANTWDYGLDFDAATLTAEIRGQYGETIDNVTDGEWDFGSAVLATTGAIQGASLDTGNGAYELYAMNQDLETTDGVSFAMIKNNALQSEQIDSLDVTFALTSNVVTVTGAVVDGGELIATLTGAGIGIYTLIFVDALVVIVDDDTHAANSIDLVGTATNLTSADDLTLMLVYDGTSFYEVSRSAN